METNAAVLGQIFNNSREAVIAASGGAVLFQNPAARRLLGQRSGESLLERLPQELTENGSGGVCSLALDGESMTVAASFADGLILLRLWPDEAADGSALLCESIASALSASLGSLHMALDHLVEQTDAGQRDDLRLYVSCIFQEYARLQRLGRSTGTLGALLAGSLPFRPELTDMDRLCGELGERLAEVTGSLGAAFRYEPPEFPVLTMADPALMEQLILSLVSNALWHARGGGAVTLSLALRDGNVLVSLLDSGGGVEEDVLPTAFSRYAGRRSLTEMSGGTGMGLALARGIARLHGGSVLIENSPGQGAAVRAVFPQSMPKGGILRSSRENYVTRSGDSVLTELSGLLGLEFYTSDSV